MIDIEDELYNHLATKLEAKFPNIHIGGPNLENIEAEFPFVYIEEADSYSPRRYQDSSNEEKYARLLYKIEIYSNKQFGKKTECKEIANYINDIMNSLNFTRDSKTQVDNISDRRLYRLVLTYTAHTDGKNLYRR